VISTSRNDHIFSEIGINDWLKKMTPINKTKAVRYFFVGVVRYKSELLTCHNHLTLG